MQFPDYHFYVAVISERDRAILALSVIVLFALEILYLVRSFRPRWTTGAALVLVGGYYVSEIAVVVFLRSGH